MSVVIGHSLRILNWQENLPSEEMPPAWMWHLDHELTDWFDEAAEARKQKYGSREDEEETQMIGNELATGRPNG